MSGDFWRQVFPLTEPEYRYSMGVRPLKPPLLTMKTARHDIELELKRAVERDPRRRPFAELEGSRDAQVELAEMIRAERPELSPAPDAPPLLAIARCVQEDLILLREDDAGVVRVIAGALHFPSVWSMVEKLGQEFLDVHRPVRGFGDADVGEKSRQFLSRLRPDKPVWRSNWTLQAGDRLDTSPENRGDWIGMREQVTPDNWRSVIHLRSEYQKLFRLPRSNAIVFCIHTLIVPILEVAHAEPEGGLLLGALRSLDPEIARYKGLTAYLPVVIEGLSAERASRGAA